MPTYDPEAMCRLCLKQPANQTGSHIIPFFILRMIDDEDGSKKRGKDLGFKMGSTFDTSYFGRSVLPEKLDEVYGDLNDEEIEELSDSPWIIDNIFCSDCEKRFSVIENEYAKTLDKYDEGKLYTSTRGDISFLFWLSVMWRVSITKQAYQLKQKHENLLRRLLDKYLVDHIEDIDLNIESDPECREISYRILRCPEYPDPMSGIFHPMHFQPYCALIGEYVIFLYLKRSYINQTKQSFFGLEKLAEEAKLNNVYEDEVILPISNVSLAEGLSNIIHFKTDERLKNYSNLLDQIHQKAGKAGQMPPALKNLVFERLTDDEKKLGRKYTQEDFIKTVSETLQHVYVDEK